MRLPTRQHRLHQPLAFLAIGLASAAIDGGVFLVLLSTGLHPAFASTVLPLFQKQQLAFIPFAGTDDLTRSHFETQDSIELGQALDRGRDYRSGFLNRLAGVLGAASAFVTHAVLLWTTKMGHYSGWPTSIEAASFR